MKLLFWDSIILKGKRLDKMIVKRNKIILTITFLVNFEKGNYVSERKFHIVSCFLISTFFLPEGCANRMELSISYHELKDFTVIQSIANSCSADK
jgi:hypothetical protein